MPAPSSKTSQPSYADRAKQATNQTTSLPANAILAPAYPSSHLPESSSSARNLGIEAYPPLAATSPKFDRKAREQSQSSSPLSMNASVGHPNDSGSSIPETHSGQTSSNKPPPPANVWHIRKDQISPARGKNLQTKSQSRPIGTTSKQTSLPDVGIGSSHSTNGVLPSHSSENVPPFTLRSQAPAFLPGEDKESWPEVSSSSRPAASVSGRGSKDGSEKAERDGARKGGVILCITQIAIHRVLVQAKSPSGFRYQRRSYRLLRMHFKHSHITGIAQNTHIHALKRRVLATHRWIPLSCRGGQAELRQYIDNHEHTVKHVASIQVHCLFPGSTCLPKARNSIPDNREAVHDKSPEKTGKFLV